MSKYIGIDYGLKRVGVAISDDSGKMAFPDKVVPRPVAKNYVLKLWKTGQFEAVVIGKSLNYNREPNRIDKFAQGFGAELETNGVNIFFEDETLTSAQAVHDQGGEAGDDSSAATLILQSFLDKLSNI